MGGRTCSKSHSLTITCAARWRPVASTTLFMFGRQRQHHSPVEPQGEALSSLFLACINSILRRCFSLFFKRHKWCRFILRARGSTASFIFNTLLWRPYDFTTLSRSFPPTIKLSTWFPQCLKPATPCPRPCLSKRCLSPHSPEEERVFAEDRMDWQQSYYPSPRFFWYYRPQARCITWKGFPPPGSNRAQTPYRWWCRTSARRPYTLGSQRRPERAQGRTASDWGRGKPAIWQSATIGKDGFGRGQIAASTRPEPVQATPVATMVEALRAAPAIASASSNAK